MSYTPQPLDTSEIQLSGDIETLIELLAKNNHENWAAQRTKEGWRYGLLRNDEKKEHPCLVPFEDLPESEKDHDRIIAKELIKTILLLGFRINKTGNPKD